MSERETKRMLHSFEIVPRDEKDLATELDIERGRDRERKAEKYLREFLKLFGRRCLRPARD